MLAKCWPTDYDAGHNQVNIGNSGHCEVLTQSITWISIHCKVNIMNTSGFSFIVSSQYKHLDFHLLQVCGFPYIVKS